MITTERIKLKITDPEESIKSKVYELIKKHFDLNQEEGSVTLDSELKIQHDTELDVEFSWVADHYRGIPYLVKFDLSVIITGKAEGEMDYIINGIERVDFEANIINNIIKTNQ
jgi:hypothetical protein